MGKGATSGRRPASQALAQFNGAEANALALRGLADPDPQVQANSARAAAAARHPRRAGPLDRNARKPARSRSPGRPREPGRIQLQAVPGRVSTCSTTKFAAAPARWSAGSIRRRSPRSREELATKSRTRRLRAIYCRRRRWERSPTWKRAFIERLVDEDHLVRAEAARTLGDCCTAAVGQALQVARDDRSLVVREAAEEALDRLQDRPDDVGTADRRPAAAIADHRNAGDPAMTGNGGLTMLLAEAETWREMGRRFSRRSREARSRADFRQRRGAGAGGRLPLVPSSADESPGRAAVVQQPQATLPQPVQTARTDAASDARFLSARRRTAAPSPLISLAGPLRQSDRLVVLRRTTQAAGEPAAARKLFADFDAQLLKRARASRAQHRQRAAMPPNG